MGLSDRDYWRERQRARERNEGVYNPKEFRGGRGGGGPKDPPEEFPYEPDFRISRTSSARIVVFWLIVLGVVWAGFHYRGSFSGFKNWALPSKQVVGPFDELKKCAALPPSGTVQHFSPAAGAAQAMTSLQFVNNHALPVVAVLGDLKTGARQWALVVNNAAKTTLQVPAGQYELTLHAGQAADWCNLNSGFASGAMVTMNGGLVAQSGLTTQVQLAATDKSPDGFSVAYNSLKSVGDASGDTLLLTQQANGHYMSAGSVNGFPLVFMVDTGASFVAISSGMAAQAGIKNCTPRTFSTANGQAQGCVATVPEMTFGGFRLSNIEVAVMPNLAGEGLLGMNVLRRFRVEQANDTLIISRH
jgi:clan AA aspartic protease (TIGR02281 family)